MADKAKVSAKSDEVEEANEDVNEIVPEDEKTAESTKDIVIAKAGKRSKKALKEAEEKEAKEERKAHSEETEDSAGPKKVVPKTRSRLERRGKSYRKLAELIDRSKVYSLSEALELASKTNPAKFDTSVELHINLNVDPRHADQNIRDNLVLPEGTGKVIKVAVFADDTNTADLKKAGADITSSEEVINYLDKSQTPFDVLIATPAQMPKLGKYARILGPRGLMPNPKSGTVTNDVVKAISEAKAGRVEYRVDSTGIVHLSIGKVSFGKGKLQLNAQAVMASVKGNKPSSVKGTYIKSVHITTTMGPSIKVEPNT